jgi:hypothetical protein
MSQNAKIKSDIWYEVVMINSRWKNVKDDEKDDSSSEDKNERIENEFDE